jgi:hypothetical protein
LICDESVSASTFFYIGSDSEMEPLSSVQETEKPKKTESECDRLLQEMAGACYSPVLSSDVDPEEHEQWSDYIWHMKQDIEGYERFQRELFETEQMASNDPTTEQTSEQDSYDIPSSTQVLPLNTTSSLASTIPVGSSSSGLYIEPQQYFIGTSSTTRSYHVVQDVHRSVESSEQVLQIAPSISHEMAARPDSLEEAQLQAIGVGLQEDMDTTRTSPEVARILPSPARPIMIGNEPWSEGFMRVVDEWKYNNFTDGSARTDFETGPFKSMIHKHLAENYELQPLRGKMDFERANLRQSDFTPMGFVLLRVKEYEYFIEHEKLSFDWMKDYNFINIWPSLSDAVLSFSIQS